MKKFFAGFIVVLVVIAVSPRQGRAETSVNNQELITLTQNVLKDLSDNNWNSETFKKYSSEVFSKNVDSPKFAALQDFLRQVGKIKKYHVKTIKVADTSKIDPKFGLPPKVYIVEGDLQSDTETAVVAVQWGNIEGNWRITAVNVDRKNDKIIERDKIIQKLTN